MPRKAVTEADLDKYLEAAKRSIRVIKRLSKTLDDNFDDLLVLYKDPARVPADVTDAIHSIRTTLLLLEDMRSREEVENPNIIFR